MQYVVYSKEFEPIVKLGEYVAVLIGRGPTGYSYVYGKVRYSEPIQPQTVNLGPISAATTSTYPMPGTEQELDKIKLGHYEFGQWRLEVLDDFAFNFRIPAAVYKWLTLNGATYATELSNIKGNLLEFYTFQDNYVPYITPVNIRFKDMELARINVYGFRYVLEKITAPPPNTPFTIIPVAAIPYSGRGAGGE